MRFLVTGGAGFIGTALANRLVQAGHEVRVLDDLSAGDPTRLHPEVSFTRGDVNDIPRLWTLLQGVECVYHLAARVSVSESMLYPRDYNTVNVGGTVAVLEAMRDAGVRRVVLSSSGAVYGEQAQQPLHEGMLPDPRSPYAVSKLAAEGYLRVMGMRWNIETVSLRIFNAYGPNQQLPTAHPPVIPSFLRHALRGSSIVVNGDGAQTRDFIYIDDVIDALVAAATAPHVNQRVINVGSGVETSVNDLIAAIGAAIGKPLTPLYIRNQDRGVSRMCADVRLAAELLNFKPKVSLAEGLALTLERDPRFALAAR
ncbi:MAG: epimerase [Candidatus Thermofonsia Clade 1 bacterium]|jgi:UDP-glucose 4-epimerase|uniref:Epimerase n=1 Tax=Candidatus Thermofonsia Clade 1 bacterium TaxID=2364210 RepID=A0A2M8PCV7_9CHLR|nr:MAG: epimerase [Candidatus Thermofonsia Clade 1 bacterium]RMF50557.1 MAG: NAD-dependent epimerase/dehydratase family protein [Chloroflexota bacterium]